MKTIKGIVFTTYDLSEVSGKINSHLQQRGFNNDDITIVDKNGNFNYEGSSDKMFVFKKSEISGLTKEEVIVFLQTALSFDLEDDPTLEGEIVVNNENYTYEIEEIEIY